MADVLKPLKLKPAYKDYIWGGEKLRKFERNCFYPGDIRRILPFWRGDNPFNIKST